MTGVGWLIGFGIGFAFGGLLRYVLDRDGNDRRGGR